jgi:hypothetical protein
VGKRALFLAAVVVSLTIPALADEVGFQGGTVFSSGIGVGEVAVPGGVPGAILFNGTLTRARTNTLRGIGHDDCLACDGKCKEVQAFSTLSPCQSIPICSGLLTESTVWKCRD